MATEQPKIDNVFKQTTGHHDSSSSVTKRMLATSPQTTGAKKSKPEVRKPEVRKPEGGDILKNTSIMDTVHGPMHFHPLLKQIVDTPQFQRLRRLKSSSAAATACTRLPSTTASSTRWESATWEAYSPVSFARTSPSSTLRTRTSSSLRSPA
jgi:hypothetical protein